MGGTSYAYRLIVFAILILLVAVTVGCICSKGTAGPTVVKNELNSSPDDVTPGNSADKKPANPVIAGLSSPTPRPPDFSLAIEGGKDHKPGKPLRLYGVNTYSDKVYLFVSGTNAPISGGRLNDTSIQVVDQSPGTFTEVNVEADGSWEYLWTPCYDSSALMFKLYNVIAVTEPRDSPHLGDATKWAMVTVKIKY